MVSRVNIQLTTLTKSIMGYWCCYIGNLPRIPHMPYNPSGFASTASTAGPGGGSSPSDAVEHTGMEMDTGSGNPPDWLAGAAAGQEGAEARGGLGAWEDAAAARGEALLEAYAAAAADGADEEEPGGGFEYGGGADDGYHDDDGDDDGSGVHEGNQEEGDDDGMGDGGPVWGRAASRENRGPADSQQQLPEHGMAPWQAGAAADFRVSVLASHCDGSIHAAVLTQRCKTFC
jgi:hypothetical protein